MITVLCIAGLVILGPFGFSDLWKSPDFKPTDATSSNDNSHEPVPSSEPVSRFHQPLFSHHDCTWETLPSPIYPTLTDIGEADCDVELTVGEDGFAKDIKANCDDPRFNGSAYQGMTTLKHQVRDSVGNVCNMIGRRIKYPISYRLGD